MEEQPIPCPYCETVVLARAEHLSPFTCSGCGKDFLASTARCRTQRSSYVSDGDQYWRIEGVTGSGARQLLEFQGDRDLDVQEGHIFTVTYRLGFRKSPKPKRLHNHTLDRSWRLGRSVLRLG